MVYEIHLIIWITFMNYCISKCLDLSILPNDCRHKSKYTESIINLYLSNKF